MSRKVKRAQNPAHDDWFQAAIGALVLIHHVNVDVAELQVKQALRLAEEAQESPEKLHGKARDWADSTAQLLRDNPSLAEDSELEAPDEDQIAQDGRSMSPQAVPPRAAAPHPFDDDMPWNARLVGIAGPGVGAGTALGFTLVYLFRSGFTATLTLGSLLAPLLLGYLVVGVIAVYDVVKRRMPFAGAAAVTAGVVAVGSLGMAYAFQYLNSWQWLLSPFIFVAIAVALALTSWLIAKVWPSKEQETGVAGAPPNRGEWDQEFVRAARARGDIPEKQIQELVAEAHEFSRQTGHSIGEEFGDPVFYAQSLPKNKAVEAGRKVLYQVMLVGLVGVLVFFAKDRIAHSGLTAFVYGAWLLLCCYLLIEAVRAWKAAKPARGK